MVFGKILIDGKVLKTFDTPMSAIVGGFASAGLNVNNNYDYHNIGASGVWRWRHAEIL